MILPMLLNVKNQEDLGDLLAVIFVTRVATAS
jgi:hypothetical protein